MHVPNPKLHQIYYFALLSFIFKLQNIAIVDFEAPLNPSLIPFPLLSPHMKTMTLNLVLVILKHVLICLLKMFVFIDNL